MLLRRHHHYFVHSSNFKENAQLLTKFYQHIHIMNQGQSQHPYHKSIESGSAAYDTNEEELKNELDNYGLEDPQKLLTVLRALKCKYDVKRIMAELSIKRSMKKDRLEIQHDRHILEHRIRKVKDVLPLAVALTEQLSRLNIGIDELAAFHSAVYEKAESDHELVNVQLQNV